MSSVEATAVKLPRGDAFGVVAHCSAAAWPMWVSFLDAITQTFTIDTLNDADDSTHLICALCVSDSSNQRLLLPAGGEIAGLCDKASLKQAVQKWKQEHDINREAVIQGVQQASEPSHSRVCDAVFTVGRHGCECVLASGDVRLVFRAACACGNVELLRDLLALTGNRTVDVHAGDEEGFHEACAGGHLGVVRELLALTGDRAIDVHAENEGGFRWACLRGNLNVVCELLALTGDRTVDVHAGDDESFWDACSAGQWGVVLKLLQTAPFPGDCIIQASLTGTDSAMVAEALKQTHIEQGDTPRALPRQIAQQVLLHALRGQCCDPNILLGESVQLYLEYLQQYCAQLAALPAAQCSSLRQALQASAKVHSSTDGDSSCSAMAGAYARLRDAVWHGVTVPYRPVRRQVDEPGLRGALVRAGRGAAVLHRVATRAWVGE